MTDLTSITFEKTDTDVLSEAEGRIAVFLNEDGRMDAGARRINRLTRGALARLGESDAFCEMKSGDVCTLRMPAGLAALAVDVIRLDRRSDTETLRKAGSALAQQRGTQDLTILMGNIRRAHEIVYGLAMRDYDYQAHKSSPGEKAGAVRVMVSKPDEARAAAWPFLAVAEGTFFTRDLVNAPANYLTTTAFADELGALEALGLKVEVLDEDELSQLGMNALLSVGQGSASPSKVVIMQWNGGAKDAKPLALIGKGVVFDTGGISLKPASGMEDMTMDMGGAGVVAGVMKALARREVRANVIGIVGLVENMPSGTATRPGDVVTTMKGDTVEIINTDAEGRLVLCDVMWYAQERFDPCAMIDLATLTGAIIIGLGHEKAGVFSNDNQLCGNFLKSAEAEGEGAWRMPLAPAYDDLLKSRIADMQNIGGRAAGSITAAQFLQRFVQEGRPWIHLDIAGVASVKSATALAPKGATGWGVAALSRLITDHYAD